MLSPARLVAAAAVSTMIMGAGVVSAQEENFGGDLVYAVAQSTGTLDPYASTGYQTRMLASHIYEGVLTRGENGEILAQLASGYEQSEDAKTFTFTLRSGVKFHNGDTMTADDVIASLQRMKDVGVDQGMMKLVESFEKVDDLTVSIHMSEPHPTFLDELSSPRVIVGIMPEEEAAKPINQIEIVGTGPFQLSESVADSHVKLERFEDYSPQAEFDGPDGFGGKRTAYVDSVIFRTVPEDGTRTAGIFAGTFHVIEQVPTTDVGRLEADPNITVANAERFGMVYEIFNVTRFPGNDINFRKAIQVGLDYETIMDFATSGNYTLGHGWQYEGYPYYSEVGSSVYNLGDTAQAQALLEQSDYNGEPVVVLAIGEQEVHRNHAVALVDQLQKLGINASISLQDQPTWYAFINQKDKWDILLGIFGMAPSLGPFGMLDHFSGADNLAGIDDPEIEDAVHRVRTSLSFEERKQAFEDYQRLIIDKAYAYQVGATGEIQAFRNEVKGFVPFRVLRAWNVTIEP